MKGSGQLYQLYVHCIGTSPGGRISSPKENEAMKKKNNNNDNTSDNLRSLIQLRVRLSLITISEKLSNGRM